MTITTAEVAAMLDVLREVDETSDSMSIENAVRWHEAVTELKAKANETLGLIETQMVATLESPVVRNGTRYEVVSNGKWRPDHEALHSAVKRAAAADENGEIRTAHDAADHAITTMRGLFVAPSTMPKTGGLENLGLKKSDVARFEGTNTKKVRVSIAEPEAP